MRKDNIIKVCEAIEALTIIYEPLYYQDYDFLLDKYFHTLYSSLRKDDLDEILYSLVSLKRIYCKNDRYSITEPKQLTIIEKEAWSRYGKLLYQPYKEFKSGQEILKYFRLCDAKNMKETKKLQAFFNKLQFNDDVDVKNAKYEFFVIPQILADIDAYIKKLEKLCKSFDKEELKELYDEIIGDLPRGFLRGYSFNEFNEILEDEIKNATYITEVEPDHTKNMNYSYVECLSLLAELEKTELYKLVDSDRVLELSINGQDVYVQILGYYGKDKAVIIYKDFEEMHYSLSLMKSDIKDIPDVTYRLSQIECLYNPEGFVDEKTSELLEDKNLPPYPVLMKLGYCKKPRLVNAKETNLVGAVLYDLLRMMKMVDKETIGVHLGEEENAIDQTVNQVYVYEDHVLFGEYEDDAIGVAYDKTKVGKLDKKLVEKVKKCNNKHIVVIGYYIFPIENNTYPWFYQIVDIDKEQIIEMEAIPQNKNRELGNLILKSLIKHDINPTSIYFNNDITYDLLHEFSLYFDKVNVELNSDLNSFYMKMYDEEDDEEMPNKLKHNYS